MRLFTTKEGKEITLLTPKEKGKKYAREIKNKIRETNDGKTKINKNTGEVVGLSRQGQAYRSGYLAARKDIGKAYQAKKNKAAKKKDK